MDLSSEVRQFLLRPLRRGEFSSSHLDSLVAWIKRRRDAALTELRRVVPRLSRVGLDKVQTALFWAGQRRVVGKALAMQTADWADDSHPTVRWLAVALAVAGAGGSADPAWGVAESLTEDPDSWVRAEAVKTLLGCMTPSETNLQLAEKWSSDPSPKVRCEVACKIGSLFGLWKGKPKRRRLLAVAKRLAVDGALSTIRWQAIIGLGEAFEVWPDEPFDVLMELAGHPNPDVRQAAACAVLEHIIEKHPETYGRKALDVGIQSGWRARATLARSLWHASGEFRVKAIEALSRDPSARVRAALLSDSYVFCGDQNLWKSDKRMTAILRAARRDPSKLVREAAEDTLRLCRRAARRRGSRKSGAG
jgi:HEAT repeat protein